MGNYNPSAPFVIGNEWVGIRDENTQFSPSVDVVEYGHTFQTTVPRILTDARFYVHAIPGTDASTEVYFAAIYPQRQEASSGPIRRLLIPCDSVFATGATTSSGSGPGVLFNPQAVNYYTLDTDLTESRISLGFNFNAYTILTGKRIVNVTLLYAGYEFFVDDGTGTFQTGPFIYIGDQPNPFAGNQLVYGNPANLQLFPNISGNTDVLIQTQRLSLGDISRFWNNAPNAAEMMPYNYTDLQRFDGSTALGSRLYATFVTGVNYSAPANGFVNIWYAAMEVSYCEETRVMIGGLNTSKVAWGANVIPMRSIARAASPPLVPGDWTITLAAGDRGAPESTISPTYPDLNALRELYQIPSHTGLQLDLTSIEGETFTGTRTHVLPQLSLHSTGGVMTEVHAYGRIYPAQVYGSVTAIQQIYDSILPSAFPFTQVRFYARRFGETTQPLVISGGDSLSSSVASISVAAFDELDEILDGWKEVTLRLSTAGVMGALSPEPSWIWSSFGETVPGNRWEVLAVQAPAVSGLPNSGDLLNTVLAPNAPAAATYQPPIGSTLELITLSNYTSGAQTEQADTDACVIFSQDPYTVTGVAVSIFSQPVTGIGEDCAGDDPCCIPTAISYVQVTWPTLAMSSSGFGAFELQRYDGVTAEWQTIMSATDPAITSFNDFEARVGQASVYRIRVLNLYRFAGAWSTQVTGTVTGAGIEMSCSNADPSGVLIFTSNSDQSGLSNLAYAMQFERSVEEAFAFNEAATQQLRRHYGRDFLTAYRPTERGGESFGRVLLVQGAAGALPNMANIKSLLDLGWRNLPYVCVRDELGNRWFANVNIPDSRIAQRSLYLATVDITEVTATPTEVDP